MAMGRRQHRERQEDLWVAHTQLASAPGHPFYERLNAVLDAEGFDRFVEDLCARFYAPQFGRPSLTPGIYFRSLLIGYFEGIGAERPAGTGVAAQQCVADSLNAVLLSVRFHGTPLPPLLTTVIRAVYAGATAPLE